MYDRIMAVSLRMSQMAVWVGGALILFAALMVTTDVLSRKVFGISLGGSDEISGYLFAISTALAFPFALLHRANVRIDALYVHFPGRLRAALDIVGLSFLALFAGFVTWRGIELVLTTWKNGSHSITPLQTPLILPQSLWLAGWLLFCVTIALLLYGMISAFLRGRLDRVQSLGGALSMEEEIEGETEGVLPQHQPKEA